MRQSTLVGAQSVSSTLRGLFVALLVLSPYNYGGGRTKNMGGLKIEG